MLLVVPDGVERTGFLVGKAGANVDVPEVIRLAKRVATRHVTGFVVQAGDGRI